MNETVREFLTAYARLMLEWERVRGLLAAEALLASQQKMEKLQVAGDLQAALAYMDTHMRIIGAYEVLFGQWFDKKAGESVVSDLIDGLREIGIEP